MENQNKENLALFFLKGLIIGVVATQALDLVGSLIYEREDEETFREENRVRGGKQAYEVGVARIAKAFGRTLTREEEKVWGWRFHKSFGIFGGIQYLALRNRNKNVGKAWGLLYGTGFFLVADEIVIYLAKMVPGPLNFNWKVHARGAVAHISYGLAAETVARAMDAFPKVLIPEDAYLLSPKMASKLRISPPRESTFAPATLA